MRLLLLDALGWTIGWLGDVRWAFALPVVAVVVYVGLVTGAGSGRDSPVLALALIAEGGLVAGRAARRHSSSTGANRSRRT